MIAYLALGLLALIGVLWLAGKASQGNPARLVAAINTYGKQAVGAALLAFSAFMAVRGNWMPGMVLAPIGLGLLKIGPWASGPFAQNSRKSTGQRSSVRSSYFEMMLDHDSGALDGTVVKGAFAGRGLSSLSKEQLVMLRRDVAADGDSLALLEAYLDRRFPGWREHVEEDAGPRQRSPSSTQAMTEEEAHQILGLQPGASADSIRAAHRALMKRLHPDTGGSTWLAAKINDAKDVLLKAHR